jgi:hypothetical protein
MTAAFSKPTITRSRSGHYRAALTIRATGKPWPQRWTSRTEGALHNARLALDEAKGAALLLDFVAKLAALKS